MLDKNRTFDDGEKNQVDQGKSLLAVDNIQGPKHGIL
jgi:hypothetical protein